MSQEYGYERQFSYEPAPKKRGCSRGCGIAAIILVVLAVVVIGTAIRFFRQIMKVLTNDPQEIVKQLHERFPTAKLPQGYQGKFGIHIKLIVEIDMMVFATDAAEVDEEGHIISGDSLLVFFMDVPGAGEDDLEVNFQTMNKDGQVIERRPHRLRAGDYEFEGFLQTVQQRRDQQRIRSQQILVPLSPTSMAIMQSTGEKVDEAALVEFLTSIAKDCPTAKKVGAQPAGGENAEKPKQK